MRKTPILLAGYGQHNRAATLAERAEALNALVIDIRHDRVASNVEWRGLELESLLSCRRYFHVPQWGELPEQDRLGVIDYSGGVARIRKHLKVLRECQIPIRFDAFILLCRCRAEVQCGRGYLGKRLHERHGYTVKPLVWRTGQAEGETEQEASAEEKELVLR